MTIWEDLDVAEVILGDIASVAAGQPASVTKTFGKTAVSDNVVVLPTGPVAPYVVFSGSFFQVLGLVLADAAAVQAGAPIQIAEKIGNTWYGHTLLVKTS